MAAGIDDLEIWCVRGNGNTRIVMVRGDPVLMMVVSGASRRVDMQVRRRARETQKTNNDGNGD